MHFWSIGARSSKADSTRKYLCIPALPQLIIVLPFRLAEDVVFAALKVCIKESCNMFIECGTMNDEAFQTLVAKHPVSLLKQWGVSTKKYMVESSLFNFWLNETFDLSKNKIWHLVVSDKCSQGLAQLVVSAWSSTGVELLSFLRSLKL